LVARTIVLIHGAWMSPYSWEPWCEHFEAQGYACIAPAWPHAEGMVDELRGRPDPALGRVGVQEIADHYEALVRDLPEPPILIGHSFGGLIVQILLDRGVGAAGVALHPAPAKGILPGASAIRANLPVIATWRGAHKVLSIDEKPFVRDFANGLTPEGARAAWTEYSVPSPGRPFFQVAFAPFNRATKVRFDNNERAPLLIVAGSVDRTVTPGMNLRTWQRYERQSLAETDFKEFDGRSHWTIGEPGWEQVADTALIWALQELE
jgi:alpha-beta hydrolase superfamily lysophospholipase